jgi:hypothetical protein
VALAFSLGFEPLVQLSGTDENGDELDLDGVRLMLRHQGVLVDYYLSEQGGLHVLGALGFAQLSVNRPGGTESADPSGSLWALGAGYDWWVSDHGSVGVLGRVSNATLTSQEASAEARLNAFSFGLHLTATLN